MRRVDVMCKRQIFGQFPPDCVRRKASRWNDDGVAYVMVYHTRSCLPGVLPMFEPLFRQVALQEIL